MATHLIAASLLAAVSLLGQSHSVEPTQPDAAEQLRITFTVSPNGHIEGGARRTSNPQNSRMVRAGKTFVEAFFQHRFTEDIHVTVAPNRAEFNKAFPAAWGLSQTECWMVGVGVADFLVFLAPTDWQKEACDHNAANSTEVQRIITHEMVHVFHGQHNPTRDFTGMDNAGWFVEGVAVLASGQLDQARLSEVVDSARSGSFPKRLDEVWTGPQRYGRAGSIVQFIDRKYGRKTLFDLLSKTNQADLLARLGLTEDQLIHDWQASLTAPTARHA